MLWVLGALAIAAAGLPVAAVPACPGGGPDQAFFPEHTFSATSKEADRLGRTWFGRQLDAIGERPLACGQAPDPEIYRLLWIRSTVGVRTPVVAVSIVIARQSAGATITSRILRRDRPRRSIPVPSTRPLGTAAWMEAIAMFSRAGFWQLDRLGPPSYDGDQWLFEGRAGERYQVVARSSARLGALGEAGAALFRLAGLTLPR